MWDDAKFYINLPVSENVTSKSPNKSNITLQVKDRAKPFQPWSYLVRLFQACHCGLNFTWHPFS